jgi:hypothetical protein
MMDALDRYRQCTDAYKALEPELIAAGQRMGAADGVLVELDEEQLGVASHPTNTAGSERPHVKRVALVTGNVVAFLLIALGVAFLGIVALYQPNPTWGAGLDWLIAILWGMGLYQVGGAASQGIQGVWNSYRSQ